MNSWNWEQSRWRFVVSALERICSPRQIYVVGALTLLSLAQGLLSRAQSLEQQSPAAAKSPDASSPLFVNEDSHIVVMEYEAWFGPNAVTFQTSVVKPLLQSTDMQAIGGGYDSTDPKVIRQHVEWLESMGIDAALIEVTNNVSCIFNSEEFARKHLSNCTDLFRSENQSIRDNTGNLYPAWSRLGTRLKLIPMLGGIDPDVLYKDTDGKTAFEKELEYFAALIKQHPELSDPTLSDNPLWLQIREFLKGHSEIARKYTFRMVAGFLDSQSDLWANQNTPEGPVEVNPEFGFWSWVDRLNPSCTMALCPYFPSYNKIGRRAENFTASIATAGQNGWGCPNPNEMPYCSDAALRYGKNGSYATLDSFMDYARELKPIFLILHQFNEFNSSDEGFNANTNDDIEPADQWGRTALEVVKEQIRQYRRATRHADSSEANNIP